MVTRIGKRFLIFYWGRWLGLKRGWWPDWWLYSERFFRYWYMGLIEFRLIERELPFQRKMENTN